MKLDLEIYLQFLDQLKSDLNINKALSSCQDDGTFGGVLSTAIDSVTACHGVVTPKGIQLSKDIPVKDKWSCLVDDEMKRDVIDEAKSILADIIANNVDDPPGSHPS